MKFKVLPPHATTPSSPPNSAYLITDNWNDWGKYRTQFFLKYIDDIGQGHSIGEVKIGKVGLESAPGRPDLPKEFESLDGSFFSDRHGFWGGE